MLLLWLFGVGVGVANACPGPLQRATAGPLPALADVVNHQHHDAAACGVAQGQDSSPALSRAGGGGHEGSTLKSNCEDFCARASFSIPRVKSALDDLQGCAQRCQAGAVVHPDPAGLPVQLHGLCREGQATPPIHIAFVRLAL